MNTKYNNSPTWGVFYLMRFILFISTLIIFPIIGVSQTSLDTCEFDSKKPISLPMLYESDIMWSRRHWEEIDLKQKINHHLYYPLIKNDCEVSLFDILKEGLLVSEEITRAFLDDRFQIPLSINDIKLILTETDTIQLDDDIPVDINKPNTYYIEKKEIKSNDVIAYRVKLAWYFNKRTSEMKHRIMGIAPVISEKVGNSIRKRTLFWIYYNDARKILAKHQVFDADNLAHPMSYDEIFLNRYYSSFIYKEENVQDRFIEEQHPNNTYKQLYEGQQIKEKLRTFEGDMWDY